MANLLSDPLYLVPPLAGAAISFALAILVLHKGQKTPANRLFLLVLVSLGLWSIFIFAMRASPDTERALFWDTAALPAGAAMPVFYYHFTSLYTHAKNRKRLWAAYSFLVATCILSAAGLVISHMTLGRYGYVPHFYPTMYAIAAAGVFFLIGALQNLIKARGNATRDEDRTRLTYMIIAIAFPLLGGLSDLFPNHLGVGIIGNILFGFVTAIAILKYHLFDIRIVMRKGLPYLLTSAAVASLYIGLLALSNHILGVTNVSVWTHIGLLVGAAFVFLPLWQRVQHLVDRWFYRQRYDFLRELERFTQETHDIRDVKRLGLSLVRLVDQALQTSGIHLLLLSKSGDFTVVARTGKNTAQLTLKSHSPIVRWLESNRGPLYCQDLDIIPRLQPVAAEKKGELEVLGVELFIPLKTKKGELIGLLLLGKKLSRQPYSHEDEQLVLTVASRIAVEVENARLYEMARQSEKVLRDSEEKIRLMFESMTEGFVACDFNGNIVEVNKAQLRMHGCDSKETLIGNTVFELIAEKDRTKVKESLKRTLENGFSETGEFTLLSKDGKEIHAELNIGVMKGTSGSSTGFVILTEDISQRKQMEAERRDIEQKSQIASRLASVGEMASGIAHEINNPLTSVIGFCQLLMEEDIPEGVREDVENIYHGAQRVAAITSRLLTFARQYKPERSSVDINEVVENTLALRAYEMETSNIQVATEFAPKLPRTMADPGQLQQVFLNIIINAETEMKLAHGRGKLLVKTEEIDSVIRIYFADDGPGIAKDNLEKIFDPFFTTREVGQGTGLGLSLCHGIVAEHSGHIYVRSKSGHGATFIVELPIIVEEKQQESAKTTDDSRSLGRNMILVVDDEPEVLQFLSKVLTGEGCEVECVDSASDALDRLKNKKYDLILLDIKLPGMSGIELYERIQQTAQSLTGKVVFITGDVMGVGTRDFLSKIEAPCISKPFDIKQLRKSLHTILREGTQSLA